MCVKCECAHCCGGRIVTYERPPSLRKPRAPHCSIDFSSSPKLWLCHRRDTHVLSSISDICTLVTTNTHGFLQTTDCGKGNRLRETNFMPLINLRFILNRGVSGGGAAAPQYFGIFCNKVPPWSKDI